MIYEEDNRGNTRVDGAPRPRSPWIDVAGSNPFQQPMVTVAIRHILSADARAAVGELVWQIERLVEADRKRFGQEEPP